MEFSVRQASTSADSDQEATSHTVENKKKVLEGSEKFLLMASLVHLVKTLFET